jgi:hypothetical protein
MSVMTSFTSSLGRQALVLKNYAPQIMFGLGTAGFIATTVMATKATLALTEKVGPHIEAHSALEAKKAINPAAVSMKDETSAKAKVLVATGKNYLPTVVVGAATLAMFGGAHFILTKRNIILTGTLLSVEKAFNEYRENVREDVGELKDLEYRFGPGVEREIVEDTPNGLVTRTVKEFDKSRVSVYARVFSKDTSKMWESSVERNQYTLKAAEAAAYTKLQADGFLILNDVYEMLGLAKTNTGMMAGWVKGKGDEFVSFGLDFDNPSARDFINGIRHSLVLDFNCSGSIFGKLPQSFSNDDHDAHADEEA